MASPQMTQNPYGNIAASIPIGPGSVSASYLLDFSTRLEGQAQVDLLSGAAVTSGAAATVNIYRVVGSAATPDTVPMSAFSQALALAGAHSIRSLGLSTGRYQVQVLNGDSANGITLSITTSTVDGMV
jgi:hypothetical protein